MTVRLKVSLMRNGWTTVALTNNFPSLGTGTPNPRDLHWTKRQRGLMWFHS